MMDPEIARLRRALELIAEDERTAVTIALAALAYSPSTGSQLVRAPLCDALRLERLQTVLGDVRRYLAAERASAIQGALVALRESVALCDREGD